MSFEIILNLFYTPSNVKSIEYNQMNIFKSFIFILVFTLLWDSTLNCQETNIKSDLSINVVTSLVWPARWFKNKKSAFSFSFDDGLVSQYENARPIMNQHNFKGTFYVIPNFLVDSLPGIWRYGTWYMFQEMSLQGHEIGSHSLNHLHLPELEIGDTNTAGTVMYELYWSRELIQQRIPDQKCITFAYPYAEHNSQIDSLTSLFYESARADGDSTNYYYLSERGFSSLSSVEVRFSEPRNTPEDDLDELNFIESWIDTLIGKNNWGILLGHEVVPFDSIGNLWHPFSIQWFTELCDWVNIKSDINSVWIETVANVTKYLKERANFNSEILFYDESQIQMIVTDTLDNNIYDYPLTIFIKVPNDWESALLIQGSNIDTLSAFDNDSGKVVMANVIPDGEVISLYKLIIGEARFTQTKNPTIRLYQNYPNPFNPETKIKFEINTKQHIKLIIYDVLGNEIATLVDDEKQAGMYEVQFSPQTINLNRGGAKKLSSGVYIYSLRTDEGVINKKMIFTK